MVDDGLCFHQRMVLSRPKQQEMLVGMQVHRKMVSAAKARVDTKMSSACKFNAKIRNILAQQVLDEHAKYPDEPLTLYQTMSYNTMREWRLGLKAHTRRVSEAKHAIDDTVAAHAKSYRNIRHRRRVKAVRPVSARMSSRRTRYVDPHDLIMKMPLPSSDEQNETNLERRELSTSAADEVSNDEEKNVVVVEDNIRLCSREGGHQRSSRRQCKGGVVFIC